MAQSTSDITGDSTALVVRTNSPFVSGIISAAVAGSLVIAGALYTDRGTASVNEFYGTGSYMTYMDAPCTNTGGSLHKYISCSVTNPYAGTGILIRMQLDSFATPVIAAKATCNISARGSTTATGTILVRGSTTGSGTSLSNTGTLVAAAGTSAPPIIYIPPASTTYCRYPVIPGPGIKARLRVWMNQQYVP